MPEPKGTLPNYAANLLQEIKSLLNFEEFILYGAAALDLLIDKNCKLRDLDIATKGISEKKILQCSKALSEAGYEILEPRRTYYINLNELVILVYAKGKWSLDIAFLNDYNSIGQYDLGSLYWRFPQLDIVDRFNAFSALENKTLTPIQGLDKENPYLLTSLFLSLCSKYDLSMTKNPSNKAIAKELAERMKKWRATSTFHGSTARTSCISAVFRALLRARDRIEFLNEVMGSSILEGVLPELQTVLAEELKHDSELMNKITTSANKAELIQFLSKIATKRGMFTLVKKLKLLKTRQWDEQDMNAF